MSETVRILAPTGDIGYVPEAQLQEAIEAGAVILTAEKMRELRQAVFMEHSVFKEKQTAPVIHKRKSLVRGRGRR